LSQVDESFVPYLTHYQIGWTAILVLMDPQGKVRYWY
jgi:hypothetical protein